MAGWEQRIVTGNPQADQAAVEQHRQVAAAQGLVFDAQPLPSGGYHVRAYPPAGVGYGPQQQQQGYGPPLGGYGPPQQQQWAGMAFSGASAPAGAWGGQAAVVPVLGQDRVRYLRKVYGLLLASVVVAGAAGMAALNLGTEAVRDGSGHRVMVPLLVSFLLGSRFAWYAMFGLLFVGTLAAGAVSKVRGLNLVALFGVAALMGVQISPMIFVAEYLAGLGRTLSTAPVAGAFLITASVFAGATSYVFITRKDFSYLGATLSMGFWVVFVGSFVAIFVNSEVFTLALMSVGAIVAGGLLLLQTSRIFRDSAMDDAVGDCLALLVQLRNLFVFVLRILMSSRR